MTRDYFRHVTDAVRKTHPDVALIPSGEVFPEVSKYLSRTAPWS